MFRSVRFAREGVEQQAPSRRKIDIVISGVRPPVRARFARKLHQKVLIWPLSAWEKS
jgi:hypothetical protein